MKTIKIYTYEKELAYYLSQIQPLDVGHDMNGQYFVFNYDEWRPLYINTINKIENDKKSLSFK